MIRASEEKLKVGSIVVIEHFDAQGNLLPAQPFMIIRECSRLEWYQGCIADGQESPYLDDAYHYFYEVTTD